MSRLKFVSGLAAIWLATSAFALDVSDYLITKGRHYLQLGAGHVILDTNNAYRFTVTVDNLTSTSLITGSVVNPRRASINMLPDMDGSPWRIRERFDYSFDLENNYPDGTYYIRLTCRNDGQRDMNFNLTGAQYPNRPVLNDYEAAQAIPVNSYTRLSWEPFVGGTATDHIHFSIEDANENNIFETPDFGEEGALTGLDTSCLIPPGALRAGRLVIGRLRFTKVLQSGHPAYPGVPGHAGYYARTEFAMRGVSGPTPGMTETLQIWKTFRMEYTRTGTLEQDEFPWHFAVRGRARVGATLLDGLLTMPSPAGTRPLEIAGQNFEYTFGQSVDQAALDRAFPSGRYTVLLNANAASREERQFDYPAAAYPSVPTIQNRETLVNPRADRDIVISWAPWQNGTDDDFVRVEIEDSLGVEFFNTPGYTRDDRLRSREARTVVPAGTLLPGVEYDIFVTFFRVSTLDFNTAPGGLIYGGYATRTKLTIRTAPPDVTSATVRLGRRAWQRGENSYEPDANRPAEFSAMTIAAADGTVLGATAQIPDGTVLPLEKVGFTNIYSVIDPSFDTLAARFPGGDYDFTTQTQNDGVKAFPVPFPGGPPPPQPRVRSLSRLQATRADVANAIAWDPWPNPNPHTDFVVVTVETATGAVMPISTRHAGDPAAIVATNSVFTIPAGVLTANRSYTVRLRFERLVRGMAVAYPGVEIRRALFSETSFYISTLTPTSFRIVSPAVAANGIQFTVTAPLQNRTYLLETSPDLVQWSPLQTYTSTALLNLPVQPEPQSGFFRLTLLP